MYADHMAASRASEVLVAALRLPRRSRVRVVEELLVSLESLAPSVEQAWIVEAERRWAAIRAGREPVIDAAVVLREGDALARPARPATRRRAR